MEPAITKARAGFHTLKSKNEMVALNFVIFDTAIAARTTKHAGISKTIEVYDTNMCYSNSYQWRKFHQGQIPSGQYDSSFGFDQLPRLYQNTKQTQQPQRLKLLRHWKERR